MAQCEDSDGAGCRPCYREPFFLSELSSSTFQLFSQRELKMTFQPNRLIAAIGCLVFACLFLSQDAAAQYYYPANNYAGATAHNRQRNIIRRQAHPDTVRPRDRSPVTDPTCIEISRSGRSNSVLSEPACRLAAEATYVGLGCLLYTSPSPRDRG